MSYPEDEPLFPKVPLISAGWEKAFKIVKFGVDIGNALSKFRSQKEPLPFGYRIKRMIFRFRGKRQ